ncbi:MAG: hypothetical protein ABWZ42_01550, partial [Ilumatobacteraceae bacterium]
MSDARTRDSSTDPFDPSGPFGEDGPFHIPSGPTGPLAVAGLDTALPLTMFPVRLATRLHRPVADHPPTELWLRIFPDLVHADGHLPELSEAEIRMGQAYWERLWRAADDPLQRDDAHRWAAAQLGAPRAAWVIMQTTPTNPASAPRHSVPADEPLRPPPKFAPLTVRTAARPTLARLLPDFWHVTVRHGPESVTRAWSTPVQRDLAMAPDLADLSGAGDVRDLMEEEGIFWMVDFDVAVEAGMALRMPWTPPLGGPFFATEVIVFGVRGDNTGADTELAELLDAHRFTSGFELVPQGTPTNNTDTVSAGFVATPPDLEAHFQRQTTTPTVRRRPAGARIGTAASANAASIALGLRDANAFDCTEHAGLLTGSWAADMNRALWPATFEFLLGTALASGLVDAVDADDRAWLAGWCRDWIRGGAFLPAFRIGSQPYGLFPVARRPDDDALGTSRRDRLAAVLLDVRDDWKASLAAVADFSAARGGNFGEAPPTPEEEALRLAAVLGAVPHPTAFRLRPANERLSAIEAAWNDGIAEMERLLAGTHNDLHGQVYELIWKDDIYNGALSEQDHGLDQVRTRADVEASNSDRSQAMRDAAADSRDHIDTEMRALVAAHLVRTGTTSWSLRPSTGPFSGANLPTPDDPPLWYVEYGDDGASADGTFPTLRLVPTVSATATASRLRDFAADARRATSIPRPGYLPGTPKPLLDKLVEQAVMVVPGDQAEELALGLEGLAAMLERDDLADPAGELTRLLRETLGLSTHRFDAWLCSLANERLSTLRAKAPTGVQIGAYGWVVNLEVDDGDGVDSHGFIHAPSLDHAATAAVLRSAWLNYATGADDAPFGVDLSSDRVRRAQWLLEGVGNGVDLAELLGARLERRLHDAGRSHLIADVRRIVLDAAGHTDAPASAIVDGLALAVAYSESTVDDPVHDAVEEWRKTLPGHPADGLGGPLRGTVTDLDATADLLTAQSVHSVLKGSLAEAAATLAVAGAGEAGIPPMRVPDVHRESQLVTHRVVAVFTPSKSATADTSLLALAEPGLANWLRSLLPPASSIDVTVEVGGDGSPGRWQSTCAELGLGAIELVLLAAVGGDLTAGHLGHLVGRRGRLELGAATDVPGRITGRLVDVAVAAGSLRALLGAARPLSGDDLATTTGLAHDVDVADLDRRRLAVAERLDELGRATPGVALLAERFADLVALDPGGVVAALASRGDAEARVGELVRRAADAASALVRPLPPTWDALTPADQAEHLTDRIRTALGVPVPVLARSTFAHQAELAESLAASARRLGPQVTPMTWLFEVGRVHEGAGRCAEALDLAEVVSPSAPVTFQVAQLPHIAGEPWVAIDAPTMPGGRLDIVAVTDAAAAIAAGPVSGLIFDAWTEP